MTTSLAVVVIGRNEGARLVRCLASIDRSVARVIYVDSGSTDGSQAHAEQAGAVVVALDTTVPFTAARARNAGVDALRQEGALPEWVQFIDGDCELQPGWLAKGQAFLQEHDDVAVVGGRKRERFPEKTVYNRLIDYEWNTPVGEARACVGTAMMRLAAFDSVGGFDPGLIAGEEPELCVRLRSAGWKIWRLEDEMVLHDVDMQQFSQWWRRTRRAGHAYAEGMAMHGSPPIRHNVTQTRRALIWGGGPMVLLVLGAVFSPWIWLALLAWPAQLLRLVHRYKDWPRAGFTLLGKVPEVLGVLEYHWSRLMGRQRRLIEYK